MMNDISTWLSMPDPGFSPSLSGSMSVPVCSESRGCWDVTQSSRQGEVETVKAALGGDMQRAGGLGDWNADRSTSWREGSTAQDQVMST